MNEEFLKYLDSLTPEQAASIERQISRESNQQKKVFWRNVVQAKRSGWKDSDASMLYRQADKIGVDSVLSVTGVSDGVRKKVSSYSQEYPDLSGYGGIGKYTKGGPIVSPDEIGGSNKSYPTPEEIEQESIDNVEHPARAKALANMPSSNRQAPSGSSGQSRPAKGGSRARTVDNGIEVLPERDAPNQGLSDFMESLKSSGFESLKKQAEEWESTYNPQPSSDRLDRQEKLNYFLQDFKGALGPLVDVVNYVEQRKQSKDASRIADESVRQAPTAPSIRGENRMLSNLIRQSQVAYSNPNQFIQPYADQTNLAYNQDITRAQELSGGQSGTAMGLGQAAAIRRDQSNLSMAPMASKIVQEGIGITGGLIGQQMQDDTWRDQQNIDLYKTANANNQELQRQAGLGLAMSRAREIQARNNALDSMLNSPVFDVNTYMNYTRDNLVNPPRI